jgi:hypothetical protein
MKPHRVWTAIIVLLLVATGIGRAQTDTQKTEVWVVITSEVRLIEAPRAEVNKLLPNTAYVMKAPVIQQLQEWVNQKKATILAQPRVTTVSGVQAQVRSVREFIYPSTYEMGAKTTTTETRGTNATTKITEQALPNLTALSPDTFRTREIGTLLNLTPTVSGDNEWIHMTLIPEFSHLSKSMFTRHEMTSPSGKTEVSQPDVYSWNATTSVVLRSGSTVLLAVLDPVSGEQYAGHENVLLVLLTATVNRAE